MAHLCADLAPLGVYAAVCKLDEVYSVLDEALKVIELCMRMPCRVVLELACHTAADHRKRLCTDLLCKKEIFIETESV